MVFCYKLITESPRRSGYTSPRKASPAGRLPEISSSFSQLISSFDYEAESSLLEDIPEREWRLLATLARKRNYEIERQKLADEFHRMWEKEKEERNLVAAETSEQYKRYLHRKREREKVFQDFKSYQRLNEEQLKTGILIDSIKHKEKRSADLLALQQDRMIHNMLEKAIEEGARMVLAADRRSRMSAAEEWRKRAELLDTMRKADDARNKKDALLRNTARVRKQRLAKRVAITNALSTWESSLLKKEVDTLDEYKRAQHAAHAELTKLRSVRLARARESRQQRARRLAVITQEMRDIVRMSKS